MAHLVTFGQRDRMPAHSSLHIAHTHEQEQRNTHPSVTVDRCCNPHVELLSAFRSPFASALMLWTDRICLTAIGSYASYSSFSTLRQEKREKKKKKIMDPL